MDEVGREMELAERVGRLEAELAALRAEVRRGRAAADFVVRPVRVEAPPVPVVVESLVQRRVPEVRAAEPVAVAEPIAKRSLENRIGSQWFNRVGIVALLIGVAWFLKLAIDNHWIHTTPTGRIIAGLVVGAGVVLWSERFRRKGYGAFSYSLKAVGTGTLYLSLWASFHVYSVLPAGVALGMMIAVTAWNAWMAWAQDAELLAVYALVGGFATPRLMGTGGNHAVFLFSYLLAMDVAVLLLVWKKPWQRLLLGSLPATVAYFIGWYDAYWSADQAGMVGLFVVLLSAPMVAVALVGMERDGVGEGLLAPVFGAGFLSLAMYSVLQDSGRHAWLPWMAVALAAVYLTLMRVRREGLVAAVHLALAVTFLTVAIPLKAEGRWIAIGWLAEGVALVWVSARMLGPEVQARVRGVMRWMACAALVLGVGQSLVLWDGRSDRAFWNAHFATEVVMVAALALAAWMARGADGDGTADDLPRVPSWHTIAVVTMLAAHVFAALGVTFEISRAWNYVSGDAAPFNAADSSYHSILSSECQAAFLMGYGALLFVWCCQREKASGLLRGLSLVLLALGFVPMIFTQLSEDSARFDSVFSLRAALELLRAAELALVVWFARRAGAQDERLSSRRVAAASVIAFNVLLLLAGVREIWTHFMASVGGGAGLAESFTISAWLMVYAAGLLGVGFWKRTAFVRWQGLVLLVFTIGKVFLYDVRNVSSGYRVLSFMGLGVLLMTVSFAYQKDWLGLKDEAAGPGVAAPGVAGPDVDEGVR